MAQAFTINQAQANGLFKPNTCPICGRDAANPYRHTDGAGRTTGCVDAFHTGAVEPVSGSGAHHYSKAAVKIRRANKGTTR